MQDQYNTVEGMSTSEFKDRGSKFIGYAVAVRTEDEVKQELERIRQEHPKSRHVCFAFSIGIEEPIERANDDGEPSGSAGRPILGQIHSAGLNNVLVAVVRYFGGALLGVPGLINAYKTAASEAVANNTIVTRYISAAFQLQTDYAHYHELMNYLKRESVEIVEQLLDASCSLKVTVPLPDKEKFNTEMTEFEGISVNFIGYEH